MLIASSICYLAAALRR